MIAATRAGFAVAALLPVASISFFTAVMAAALRDVYFAPDDGLHVALAGFVEEIGRGKQVAVVCDRHGGHFLPGRLIEKLCGFASTVEQAVIRMNVQMNKRRVIHGPQF